MIRIIRYAPIYVLDTAKALANRVRILPPVRFDTNLTFKRFQTFATLSR